MIVKAEGPSGRANIYSADTKPALVWSNLAYIAGNLGTLVGAELTNLDKVRGLGAPVASIDGAGTFDGIFLTGILAVLLASLYPRPRPAQAR